MIATTKKRPAPVAVIFTEAQVRAGLDGTFTRVGGWIEHVPPDYMPSFEMVPSDGLHLTEGLALAILQHFRREGGTYAEIARIYKVNHSTVCKLVQGKTWRHLSREAS